MNITIEEDCVMAKLLTNREMELFRLAMQYADAALAIGNKRTQEELASIVAKELSFKIDEDDLAEMCETIEGS